MRCSAVLACCIVGCPISALAQDTGAALPAITTQEERPPAAADANAPSAEAPSEAQSVAPLPASAAHVAAAAATVTATATATQPAADTKLEALAAPKPSFWSVGAGVGFGTVGTLAAGRPLLSNALGNTPYGTALVELAASQRLRLSVGALGSYTHNRTTNDQATAPGNVFATIPGDQSMVGATLSARWVLNPGAIVEVSPSFTFGGYRSVSKSIQPSGGFAPGTSTPSYLRHEAIDYGLDAVLGLVLEHALLPQLFLRLESGFVRASLSHNNDNYDSGSVTGIQHVRQISTAVTLDWSPALQLRLGF